MAAFLLLLLAIQPVTNIELHSAQQVDLSAKNSGVDLSATDVSIRYSNPSDESQYKMFSSNHPIFGFERPKDLYVVDSVNATPMDIEVTVRNNGVTPSGIITLQLLILHNEYDRFELANRTVTMNSLTANAQANATFYNVYVNYAGNHTLLVKPSFQGIDDNPANDVLNRHYTVAHSYFTCTSLVGWNTGPYWGTSSDTSLSMGQSCHIGQGQFGSYTNNLQTDLMTPIWDMSDIVSNPTRTNGVTFFYAGSAQPNDNMKVYAFNNLGNWDELANIAGTVGETLSNWKTISNNHMGHTTPLIPTNPATHFHANSRFKFTFTSDSSGTDIGYYFDDFVIVYDQSARMEEYSLDVSGVFTNGAIPGAWGKIRLLLSNTGNISDSILPTVTNLPNDWNVAYSYPNGAGINPSTGVRLLPGESREIDVKLQPDANATIGFVPLTFNATSLQNPNFFVQEPMQFQVSADRIPYIHMPEAKPKCPPGSTCAFYVDVENIGQATDVFDLQVQSKSLDAGWSVSLAFDQSPSVRLVPNQIQEVKCVMTVPANETPDKTGDFWLTLVAQNDTSRSTTEAITVQASMISDALVELNIDSTEVTMLTAGERIEIQYTITNQATRQDSFDLSVDSDSAIGWTVEEQQRPAIVINPGASTSFYVAVTAPENAQANDKAPEFKPILTSTRSGTQYEGPSYDNIRIEPLYDASIEILSNSDVLVPGGVSVVDVQLENKGNGPTSVSVYLVDTPDSWMYDLRKDGVILEQNEFDLGVSYMGASIQEIEVLIYVPMTEAAREIHTVTIGVETEGQDINPEDNYATVDMITGSISFPTLNGSTLDTHAHVGSTQQVTATVTNVGNALESTMDVGFELSTSPPTTDVVAFLTAGVGGPSSESGEILTFPMGAGTSKLLIVDVVVGDDVPLNTRIVITIFVEGGQNDEGSLVSLQHQNLIMVDQQRKVEMSLSNPGSLPIEKSATTWFNMTSSSTQTEEMQYTFTHPDGWQIMCDGVLVLNQESQVVSLSYERNKDSMKDIRCEIQRLGGPYKGEIQLSASTTDESIQFSDTRIIEFAQPPADESFFSSSMNGPTMIAGGVGIVLLGIILLVVRKQLSGSPMEDDSMSGPPISQQTTVNVENTPQDAQEINATASNKGPPLPDNGLPDGWSMEQWEHYGQQYLDRLGKQP